MSKKLCQKLVSFDFKMIWQRAYPDRPQFGIVSKGSNEKGITYRRVVVLLISWWW